VLASLLRNILGLEKPLIALNIDPTFKRVTVGSITSPAERVEDQWLNCYHNFALEHNFFFHIIVSSSGV